MIRDKLASVKASVSIVDVLRRHGVNVSAGTQTQISCPFHGADTHPSARVYTSTNTIFCWTCHKLWDVIAAEMEFTGLDLAAALDVLVADFGVTVHEAPQELQRFYGYAAKYQRGDQKQTESTVLDLGDRYRRYYMSLGDWRLLEHVIDYFWQEFDELEASNHGTELLPSEMLDKAVDWFGRAHAMISAQHQSVLLVTSQKQPVFQEVVEGDDED